MKTIFSLFLFLCSHSLWSQQSLTEVFLQHPFTCDSGSTTIEINICTGEKADFADSLLNKLFNTIVRSLDQDIKNFAQMKSDSRSDSTERITVKKLKNYYSEMRLNFIKAHQQWKKSREADCHLEAVKCSGGTGCTAYVNMLFIDLTLARIKQLEDFQAN